MINRKKILCGIVAGILALSAASPAFAQEDLSSLEGLFLNGDFPGVVQKLDAMPPGRFAEKDMPRVRYIYAVSLVKMQKYEEAVLFLEAALRDTASSRDQLPFLVCLLEAQYQRKNYAAALEIGLNVLNVYPKSMYEPRVLLRTGQMYVSIGNAEKASYYLKQVINTYPLSFEAKEAKASLESPEVCQVIQVGAYTQEENARELKEELTKKGYPAFVSFAEKNNTRYYRVRVSCFTGRESLNAVIEKLKKDGYSPELVQ